MKQLLVSLGALALACLPTLAGATSVVRIEWLQVASGSATQPTAFYGEQRLSVTGGTAVESNAAPNFSGNPAVPGVARLTVMSGAVVVAWGASPTAAENLGIRLQAGDEKDIVLTGGQYLSFVEALDQPQASGASPSITNPNNGTPCIVGNTGCSLPVSGAAGGSSYGGAPGASDLGGVTYEELFDGAGNPIGISGNPIVIAGAVTLSAPAIASLQDSGGHDVSDATAHVLKTCQVAYPAGTCLDATSIFAATDASGVVAAGGTYQIVVSGAGSRHGCLIQNPPDAATEGIGTAETLKVKDGSTVWYLTPGATFSCNNNGVVDSNTIQVTSVTAGHAFAANYQ